MECSVSDRICPVEGCTEPLKRSPMCRRHQRVNWNKNKKHQSCSIENCDNRIYSTKLKLCELHTRERKIGLRTYGRHGYVFGFMPDHPNASKKSGMVAEHRMIMSNHIGRPLFKHETVHHKNGQRDDNRLENLELWSDSQPAGQRVEDKINWCIEYLKENGYEVRKM